MIRAILWKEWREHRWKYASYWLALNLPILTVALCVALSSDARAPFGDLADGTAAKYLAVALFAECGLFATLFLFVAGFFAIATFSPELESGAVYFLYEQPLPPWKYAAFKVLNGIVHTALAVTFAVLFAPVAAYALMLLGGKVTMAGSLASMSAVMMAAGRAAVWCGLLSVGAFAGSALLAGMLRRWWLALAAAIVFIVLSHMAGNNFFDFIQPAFDAIQPGTSSISIGAGSPQWLSVGGTLPVQYFAPWRALPLLTAFLLTLLFAAGTGFVYSRKEVR